MKKIGLVGGTSWQSTVDYYRTINELVQDRLGGNHNAPMHIESVDFSKIAHYVGHNNFGAVGVMMLDASRNLRSAGCDVGLMCSNTIHEVYEGVHNRYLPFLHIQEPLVAQLKEDGVDSVGVLGTKNVMQSDRYRKKLGDCGVKCSCS